MESVDGSPAGSRAWGLTSYGGVDGTVVIEAIGRSAAVVTSDRDDIAHLVQAAGADLPVIDI